MGKTTPYNEANNQSLADLLGDEYYEELQLKSVVDKATKGAFMPPLHEWLRSVNPDFNWDWRHTKYIIEHLQKLADGDIKKLMISCPPRHGKQFAKNTPVLTPSGWKTHGELQPGDKVYHPSGKPIHVVAVSEPTETEYTVTLSTGETLETHGNHEWYVHSRHQRKHVIIETKQMLNEGIHNGLIGQRGSRYYYHIDTIQPVAYEYKELEMDPYVLGAWLGDGTSDASLITHAGSETAVIDKIVRCGYAISSQSVHKTTGVYTTRFGYSGMIQQINSLGVFKDKHIPEIYKLSSIDQRQELIAGLIDTDGHVDRKGRVRIVTVSEKLADDIVEVLTSLGQYPYKTFQEPTLSTSGIQGTQRVYTVGFQPSINFPTVLKRKQIKVKAKRKRIAITNISPVGKPTLGNCIQVDSSDGMYLVGRTLIPTHNSELASIHFPTYFLEKNPENRVIVGTYNQTLANKLSRKIRSLCRDRIPLNNDKKAMEEWETKAGGGVRAVGVGGGIAGVGANLIILDDVVRSRKDASSLTVRNSTYSWYTDDIYTRFEPDSRICVIMTRWHEDDLIGRINNSEDSDDWVVINLPALAEENDPLGREPGEALCPERYDRKALIDIKKVMGRSFTALYQGHPTEQEGEIFKASWFRSHTIKTLPTDENYRWELVRYWDKASSTSGDYTVGILMAKERTTGEYYIIDMVRGKWNSHKRDKIILETAAKDVAMYSELGTVKIRHEQEPGSSGKDAAKATNKLLAGFSVKAVKSTGNKKLRSEPYANQCEAGNIWMLKADWNEDFIDEHAVFDNGKHDDIVDAASGAFNELSKGSAFISFFR